MKHHLALLAAAAIFVGSPALAAGTFSGLPDASFPLGGTSDYVPLDQGSGCPTQSAPCTTSRSPSLRVGQPYQAATQPASPFTYQPWWDTTTVTAPILKYYDGAQFVAVGSLDTVAHAWNPVFPTGIALSSGILTLGGAGQIVIGATSGPVAGNLTTQPQWTFRASGANPTQVAVDTAVAGKSAYFLFRDAGVNKWQVQKDDSNNFSLFDNGTSLNALQITPGGGMTLGEAGQITLGAGAAAVIGNQATALQATFKSSGANPTQVTYDTGAAGQPSYVLFKDFGTNKWQVGKEGNDKYQIFDNANATNVMEVDTAGKIVFGEGGALTLVASGGVQIGAPTGGDKGAGTLNVAGAIWANGTQGLATCSVVTAGATITVKNGLVTAFTGC